MKVTLLIVCLLSALSAVADSHIHVPLDLTFEESLKWNNSLKTNKNITAYEPKVRESIDGGEKMNRWLKLINKDRSENSKLRLTSKTSQRGIPIDKPSVYGPKSIKENYLKLEKNMPKVLHDVFYGNKKITATNPVSDADFIIWAKKASKQYQTAVRWTGMKRWLPQLAARRVKDVRGYFYLKNLENLDYSLRNLSTLNNKIEIKAALIGICINSRGLDSNCKSRLAQAISTNKLVTFKNDFWSDAKKNWVSFFNIPNPRTDVTWSRKAPNTMTVEFKNIPDLKVSNWLKDNVEDEFQIPLKNWNMEIKYTNGRAFPRTAYLEFKPNVTPHVSGGNQIVMDANTALEEYGVKWTIRHEFGHILRIPDCYHEFYDTANNTMINYQLDTTDLMCSRAGSMNDRIYNELKRVYFK